MLKQTSDQMEKPKVSKSKTSSTDLQAPAQSEAPDPKTNQGIQPPTPLHGQTAASNT